LGQGKGKKIKFNVEQATKAQRGVEYTSTLSLTSALDGGGWSTPHSGRFTSGKDTVRIVQEAGWGLRVSLERCGNSLPHRDSIPGPSSP